MTFRHLANELFETTEDGGRQFTLDDQRDDRGVGFLYWTQQTSLPYHLK